MKSPRERIKITRRKNKKKRALLELENERVIDETIDRTSIWIENLSDC